MPSIKGLGLAQRKTLISGVSGDRPIASSLTLVSIFRTTWFVLANESGVLQSNTKAWPLRIILAEVKKA